MEAGKRIGYLDSLKILAAFGVIYVHIVSGSVPYVDILGIDWHVFNLCQSATRWMVPMFFMCSGAVFLGRDIEITKIFTKYVPKMFLVFFVWSLFYSLHDVETDKVADYIKVFLTGHFHMWYIPTMIGIYLCLPFLRKIAKDESILQYFVILFLVFSALIPTVASIVRDFAPVSIYVLFDQAIYIITNSKPAMVIGAAGYFMLGYYLSIKDYDAKGRKSTYFTGIVGFVLTVFLSICLASKTGENLENYYGVYSVNVSMMAIGLFVFGKYNLEFESIVGKVTGIMAKYSLGVFILHPFVIDIIVSKIGISTFSFGNVLIGVVILGIMAYVISFLLSVIIRRIPIVGRYLV